MAHTRLVLDLSQSSIPAFGQASPLVAHTYRTGSRHAAAFHPKLTVCGPALPSAEVLFPTLKHRDLSMRHFRAGFLSKSFAN